MGRERDRGAESYLPRGGGLPALRRAAAGCRGCELWKDAEQTVFGEGTVNAELLLVGEQPGDKEDRAGAPFVGPAGRILDDSLARAGIPRKSVYVTNAVKHFKWRSRAARRIHQAPRVGEVEACKPWLEAEIEAVAPRGVVALGATATRALLGSKTRVMRDRGQPLELEGADFAVVTIHPSAVLRGPPEEREDALAGLVDDLRVAGMLLDGTR
jgi:DNA polymerase